MAPAHAAPLLSALLIGAAAADSPAGQTNAARPTHALLDVDSFESLHLAAWRIEAPLRPPQVLLEPEYEWEADVHSEGTILIDPFDQLYKAYYVSAPETYPAGGQTWGRMLTIATSTDGENWTRPMLDLVPYGNASRTNILLKLGSPTAELSQISVFANATAPAGSLERYAMFLLGSQPPQSFLDSGLGVPASCAASAHTHCMYRFESSDGIDWRPGEAIDPARTHGSDGSFVYREPDGSLAAYIKASTASPPGGLAPYDIGAGGQRMMVMSRSANGSVWGRPYYCSQPDWRDANGDQFVGLYGSDGPTEGFTGIDGQPVYVGVMGVMHTLAQTIDNQFMISKQGEVWWRPERRPNVPLAPLGEWGGGLIWPFRTLTVDRDVGSDLLSMYFSGTEGIHGDMYSTQPMEDFAARNLSEGYGTWGYNDLRLKSGGGGSEQQYYSPVRTSIWFKGAMMRASWGQGRLWALVPASGGRVPATVVSKTLNTTGGGTHLVANIVTYRGGTARAELINAATGDVIAGFSMEECVPFQGDAPAAQVAWKQTRDPPSTFPPEVRQVKVRWQLERARLYGFRVL